MRLRDLLVDAHRFPVLFALVVVGCTAVATPDPAADTEMTDSTPAAETTGNQSTVGSSTTTTTAASDATGGQETTAPADDSSSSDDGGFIDRPDAGNAPAGICLGVSEVGHLATIAAATEEPVDLACDPTPGPCGGDIVGTWTTVAHCGLDALPNFFENECPGSTMEIVGSTVEGTRTFEEDGGYASDTSLVLDLEVVLDPMDCYGVDCETFGALLDDADNNLDAVCETAEGGDCTCLMTISNAGTLTGTWELEDDALVLTVNGEELDPVPLCVDGDRLQTWDALHESQVFEDTPCDDEADCEEALGDAYETWYCLI